MVDESASSNSHMSEEVNAYEECRRWLRWLVVVPGELLSDCHQFNLIGSGSVKKCTEGLTILVKNIDALMVAFLAESRS